MSEKGISLEISWAKLSPMEARGKLVFVNIYYQNVDQFRPDQGKDSNSFLTNCLQIKIVIYIKFVH